jgi:hypothetical protein
MAKASKPLSTSKWTTFKEEVDRRTEKIGRRDVVIDFVRDDLSHKRLECQYIGRDQNTYKGDDLPDGFWAKAVIHTNDSYAVLFEQIAIPRQSRATWVKDGVLSNPEWFDQSQPQQRPRIFAEAFAIKVRPARAARQSTSLAATQCLEYLTRLMRQSPTIQPKSKTEYSAHCLATFRHLSKRSFENAWEKAKRQTGAEWGKSGRRKKSPH